MPSRVTVKVNHPCVEAGLKRAFTSGSRPTDTSATEIAPLHPAYLWVVEALVGGALQQDFVVGDDGGRVGDARRLVPMATRDRRSDALRI